LFRQAASHAGAAAGGRDQRDEPGHGLSGLIRTIIVAPCLSRKDAAGSREIAKTGSCLPNIADTCQAYNGARS
jgi:hypothetical protein